MTAPSAHRAFGLDITSELLLPSLAPLDRPPREPTRVRVGDDEQLARAWPTGAERIVQEGAPGTARERFTERHPDAGHRLVARGYGQATISPDGRTVLAAPGGSDPGLLERLLVARVLPWAALIQGVEAFHASAVTIDGRAVMLTGASGAGKTSLAVQLVLGGAGFLTDDVLAVDRDPSGGLRAHCGARHAGLREAERARLAPGTLGPLRPLDEKSWASLDPPLAPVGLGAVMYITRPAAGERFATDEPTVERLTDAPAQMLLSSTFVLGVRDPGRLVAMLSLCADIAAAVPQYRVRVRPELGSETTAAAIRAALG